MKGITVRHTSVLMMVLLLGCSGTPVNLPTTPTYPDLLPPPKAEKILPPTSIDSIVKYRDSIDTYVEYLKDYSNRLSTDHGLRPTHRTACPTLVHAGVIVIPPTPVTSGLDNEQVIEALIKHIGDLRNAMVTHNRALSAAKDNVDAVCKIKS